MDASTPLQPSRRRAIPRIRYFELAISLPVIGLMAYLIPRHIEPLRGQGRELVFWVLIVALVDMLPIPAWRDLQMDMSFPLLMAVAILYDPTIALLVAFVGSFDPREIRREIDIWRA